MNTDAETLLGTRKPILVDGINLLTNKVFVSGDQQVVKGLFVRIGDRCEPFPENGRGKVINRTWAAMSAHNKQSVKIVSSPGSRRPTMLELVREFRCDKFFNSRGLVPGSCSKADTPLPPSFSRAGIFANESAVSENHEVVSRQCKEPNDEEDTDYRYRSRSLRHGFTVLRILRGRFPFNSGARPQ
jgi:hypothetical protein